MEKLERKDFKIPNKSDIEDLDILYPINNIQFTNIKTRLDVILNTDDSINKIEYLLNPIEDKFINEYKNHIYISRFYLENLAYYSSLKPNMFKGGEYTANSILYQTNYEMFYSKITSSFDRYLHLLNIYYKLELKNHEVTKHNIKYKIINKFNSDNSIITFWEKLDTLKVFNIRNKFIHNELIYENEHKFNNQKKEFYDCFQYKNKTQQAIDEFKKYNEFMNKYAFPLLYRFREFI